MATHNEKGRVGESMACDYLREKGYAILETNWRYGKLEADIIAYTDDIIVFVEVKTRRSRLFGDPEEAVDYQKLQNLQGAMNHYIKYHHIDREVRLDIISIVGTIGTIPQIDHIMDIVL